MAASEPTGIYRKRPPILGRGMLVPGTLQLAKHDGTRIKRPEHMSAFGPFWTSALLSGYPARQQDGRVFER